MSWNKVAVKSYTLSHFENDRDVTERAQGYTLQDASFIYVNLGVVRAIRADVTVVLGMRQSIECDDWCYVTRFGPRRSGASILMTYFHNNILNRLILHVPWYPVAISDYPAIHTPKVQCHVLRFGDLKFTFYDDKLPWFHIQQLYPEHTLVPSTQCIIILSSMLCTGLGDHHSLWWQTPMVSHTTIHWTKAVDFRLIL